MLKNIAFLFIGVLALSRVGFCGVPYFSNYPFSFHHQQENDDKAQKDPESIMEQSEQTVKENRGIDIVDLGARQKRDSDLGEDLERIEIQKQINQDDQADPSSFFQEIPDAYPVPKDDPASFYKEIRKNERKERSKRQDHPHPHIGEASDVPMGANPAGNMIGQVINPEARQPKANGLITPDSSDPIIGIPINPDPAEPNTEVLPFSTPIEQIPPPTDSIDQFGHVKSVSNNKKESSSSSSKEKLEEDGRKFVTFVDTEVLKNHKVQNVPPRPTSAGEMVEMAPNYVQEIPPKPEQPILPNESIEVGKRLRLKRDLIGIESDIQKAEETQALPAQTPEETKLIRARRYIAFNDVDLQEEEI